MIPADEARARVAARLHALLAGTGLRGEVAVVDGPPGPAIARLAEERRAELVVVGTCGRVGLDRLLLGSVAAVVVRDAPCAVLVARRG